MTCTHAALVRQQMIDLRLRYDTLLMEEAGQILEVETFVPMVLQKTESGSTSRLKRIILLGDHHQLPPVVKNRGFQQHGHLDQSMFSRFIRLRVPYVQLDAQGRCRPSLRELFSWRYTKPPLKDLPKIAEDAEFHLANAGLTNEFQFVNVPDFEGYPKENIVMLTTYNGQKELLKDVVRERCGWNPLIGWPSVISTVDKFQGQQADYVILSLVRTRAVGHLRDVRRLIVAVSRARLGLYIFGRHQIFAGCLELQSLMKHCTTTKLALNLQEVTFPTDRQAGVTGPVILIEDVYDMIDIVRNVAGQLLQKKNI